MPTERTLGIGGNQWFALTVLTEPRDNATGDTEEVTGIATFYTKLSRNPDGHEDDGEEV